MPKTRSSSRKEKETPYTRPSPEKDGDRLANATKDITNRKLSFKEINALVTMLARAAHEGAEDSVFDLFCQAHRNLDMVQLLAGVSIPATPPTKEDEKAPVVIAIKKGAEASFKKYKLSETNLIELWRLLISTGIVLQQKIGTKRLPKTKAYDKRIKNAARRDMTSDQEKNIKELWCMAILAHAAIDKFPDECT